MHTNLLLTAGAGPEVAQHSKYIKLGIKKYLMSSFWLGVAWQPCQRGKGCTIYARSGAEWGGGLVVVGYKRSPNQINPTYPTRL